MKHLNTDNPLPTAGAAKAVGMSIFTIRAIKRSLGIKGRYVMPSVIRKFMRDNPGFMPTRVYHNDSCHCKVCRAKRSPLPVNEKPAAPDVESTDRLQPKAEVIEPSPIELPSVPRSHSSLGRMVKKYRKSRKISTHWIAEQTGISRSCIYKLERTGQTSVEVVKNVGRLICSTHQDYMTLIAQWIREHVGDEISELRIETINKDDQLALQMERLKTLIGGLSPNNRVKILFCLSDKHTLDFLCNSNLGVAANIK